MKKIADLQREHPLIGRFHLWDWLLPEDKATVSERTVGRAMAFNRFVHQELTRQDLQKSPRLHPFKAKTWHQFWFIDHRYLIKIDGVQYYSLCILEGYSRAFLSGVVLATQARGPVLKLLYETVLKWGAPGALCTLNQEQWQRIRRLNRQHRARFSRCRNHPQLPIAMEK